MYTPEQAAELAREYADAYSKNCLEFTPAQLAAMLNAACKPQSDPVSTYTMIRVLSGNVSPDHDVEKLHQLLRQALKALKVIAVYVAPVMKREVKSQSNSQWMVERAQEDDEFLHTSIANITKALEGKS